MIDVGNVVRCAASFTCGLSHPGLGSSTNSTMVDLGTCERTVTSSSGPYEATPTPRDAAPKPTPIKLDTATCQRIATAAAAVTKAETLHHEPAQMDTAACTVELTCGTDHQVVYSVQRQTTQIADHVSALITAINGH